MTPAQQATAELHAAFWNTPYTNTLVALAQLNSTLPRRTRDMMKQEAIELREAGLSKAPKGHSVAKGRKK